MSVAELRYEAGHGVARITLDNQARRNAMTCSMWAALPAIISRAEADAAVRVIVLRGAGGEAFCAGADISEFGEKRTGAAAVAYEKAAGAAEQALAHAARPTLAVIDGYCFGGGMMLAMACDLRLAADDARFRIPAGRLGVGYGFGNVRSLVHKLGPDAVADILFTARVVDADEAGRLGIARVLPRATLDDAVAATIRQIAENAPLTLRAVKRALVELARPEAEQDRAAAEAAVAACFTSDDYAEGRRAFLEKRQPRFRGA